MILKMVGGGGGGGGGGAESILLYRTWEDGDKVNAFKGHIIPTAIGSLMPGYVIPPMQ